MSRRSKSQDPADREPESSEGTAEAPEEHGPSVGDQIREQVVTLVIAIAVALAIRAFVVEPFRIPSGSMLPTLLIGDHLFVNKFVYGIKVPFTDYRLPGLREPERGDVVVFSVGRSNSANGQSRIIPADRQPELRREDFVKRIIGMPGDRIEYRHNRLYVNGEEMAMVDAKREFEDERGVSLHVFAEKLDGCEHAVLDDLHRNGPSQTAFTVEPGRYFMMGDNRDNSNDSRGWGTVRKAEFKGPAFILYWSWDTAGSFLQLLNPINWFTVEKRWDRIFKRVKCGPVEAD